MCQNFLKILLLCICSSVSNASDEVSSWLQQVGCDDLLVTYLEDKLANGTQQEKFAAANELGELYTRFLSLGKYRAYPKLLQRAITLLKNNKQVGSTSLKVQLLRARYLTAEQTLENYRLRYTTRNDAVAEINQLKEIVNELLTIRTKLIDRTRQSQRQDLYDLIGMSTSLLAWSHYYIAWFESSGSEAEKAQEYFAEMIQAEDPTFAQMSFDLKAKEYGARAILGIALCKKIIFGSSLAEVWFDELQKEDTFIKILQQIQTWKFFLDIDDHLWLKVSEHLELVSDENKLMFARLAAVHALENAFENSTSEVAKQALTMLIKLGQLSMVSEIVEQYGFDNLPLAGFISNYIRGDLAYRELSIEGDTIEPAVHNELKQKYIDTAKLFLNATLSEDASEYPAFLNDCYYMLGLSLYHASEFEQASIAFQAVSSRQNDEESLWMAIVCLDQLDVLDASTQDVKNSLIKQYRNAWSNSTRAAQLLVRDSAVSSASMQLVQELLQVPKNDPNYVESQKQAAVHLYELWVNVQESQVYDVGNEYVNVAMPLLRQMINDVNEGNVSQAESAVVLALRILEISLHEHIRRNIAARQALGAISEIKKNGSFDLSTHGKEITYRTILLELSINNVGLAQELLMEFILLFPHDLWSQHAAKAMWRFWDSHQIEVPHSIRYEVGNRLLTDFSDEMLVQEDTLPVSYATSYAGYELIMEFELDVAIEEEVLRISRLLCVAYPKTNRIIELAALLEQQVGNSARALVHWRTVASGNKQGSENWLKARLNIITIIAESNPSAALEVLDQHHLLYPNYGIGTYGAQLKVLHATLKESR